MAKNRKKKIDGNMSTKTPPESSQNIEAEAEELQPISVWAQQIKAKLVKSQPQPVTESTSSSLPSPLAAIVQENTVAKMARVLKEKMLAFRTADTLVTTCVDSSEVTFPSPVPPLEAVLNKPLPEDVAPLPVLTVKEKFGHTYQRSCPPPKKRNLDGDEEDSDEDSKAGIQVWLVKEEVADDSAEPALQDTNAKQAETKKRRKNPSHRKEELPRTSRRGSARSVKKSKENPKKVTKKTPAKKEIVVKKKQIKKRKVKV